MADIEQQARELLAVVHEANGRLGLAALVRNRHIPASDPAITALISVLHAEPSVPKRLTIPMRATGCGPNHDYIKGWNACIEHIQATPVTLATVKPPADLRTHLATEHT